MTILVRREVYGRWKVIASEKAGGAGPVGQDQGPEEGPGQGRGDQEGEEGVIQLHSDINANVRTNRMISGKRTLFKITN